MRVWISFVFAVFVSSCSGESDPADPEPEPGPGDPSTPGDDSGQQPGTPDAAQGGGNPSPTPTPDAPPAGPACAAPGATGNEKGVGEYCTPGGGECDDNDGATFCTVDYQDDAPPFCTMLCFGDGGCGADAMCASAGSGPMGCTPSCVLEGI